jgi:hypothetical protein
VSNSRIKGVHYKRAPLRQRIIDRVRWVEKCNCNVRVDVAGDGVINVAHEKRCWSWTVKAMNS